MSAPVAPSPGKYLAREMDSAAREFYRRLSEDGQLATTHCEHCQTATFPPRPRCPRCGREQGWRELPRAGRLHAFTTQESALRFGAPLVLALAELGAVVVPGIVEAPYGQLRVGHPIEVQLRPEPETGLTLLRFIPRPP